MDFCFFLCECFDVPKVSDIKGLESVINVDRQELVYHALFNHPQIIFNHFLNLIFLSYFGVYPGKVTTFVVWISFLTFCNIDFEICTLSELFSLNTTLNKKKMIIFIHKWIRESTIKKYIPNTQLCIAESETEIHAQMNTMIQEEQREKDNEKGREKEKEIEMALKNKLFYRILPLYPHVSPSDFTHMTLYEVYRSLFPNTESCISYYKQAQTQIKENDLFEKNIYNEFYLYPRPHTQIPLLEKYLYQPNHWDTLHTTECISYVLLHDNYFMRHLRQQPVIIMSQTDKNKDTNNDQNECLNTITTSIEQKMKTKALVFYDQNAYGSFIFTRCVPHIAGCTFFVGTPSCYSKLIDLFGLSPISISKSMPLLRKTNILFHTNIMVDQHTQNTINLKQLHKGCPTILETKNTFIYQKLYMHESDSDTFNITETLIPLETELWQDLFTTYLSNTVAKTPREIHVSNSLFIFKHHLYIHLFCRQLTLKNLKNLENLRNEKGSQGTLSQSSQDNQGTLSQGSQDSQGTLSQGSQDSQGGEYALFYIDTRENIGGVIALAITMKNLSPSWNWNIIIMTPQKNEAFYCQYFGSSIYFIHDPIMDTQDFGLDHYNIIMKNADTWQKIKALGFHKILLIQDDSMILKPGLEKQFMKYDYVGPPWLDCPQNKQILDYTINSFVGNGGLSLRNVDTMIMICSTFIKEKNYLFNDMLQPVQEDVYFSSCISHYNKQKKKESQGNQKSQENQLKEIINIPNYTEASLFGMEQVFNKDALGIHKFWVYNTPKNIRLYFEALSHKLYR